MPFPLLRLLPGILKTVASVTGLDIVKQAADAIGGAALSPEQEATLQAQLQRHEEAMKALSIDEMKTAMSESLAMISSSDKYVSRARPTGLYIFYAVAASIAVAKIFGSAIDPTAILTILAPLAGVGGAYVFKRTEEKLTRNGNSE